MADIDQNEVVNFSFTVEQANALLQILGNAPYVQSKFFIESLQTQAAPRIAELQAAADAAAANDDASEDDAGAPK